MACWYCPGHIKVRTVQYSRPCTICCGYARGTAVDAYGNPA